MCGTTTMQILNHLQLLIFLIKTVCNQFQLNNDTNFYACEYVSYFSIFFNLIQSAKTAMAIRCMLWVSIIIINLYFFLFVR